MSYVGLSPEEERRMLATIGVDSFERLIEAVPSEVRLREPLQTPGPLSEIETRRQFGSWARENAANRAASFLGGGLYEHYIPSAVNALAMRSEFATAYTPYQPEVAQGTLTAIYEFQSMIVDLTGTDVANASLYDGATAAVEAALLARHQTGRRRVVVAGALHPNYVGCFARISTRRGARWSPARTACARSPISSRCCRATWRACSTRTPTSSVCSRRAER
jgi:glycine dehydrogenase subunit 1